MSLQNRASDLRQSSPGSDATLGEWLHYLESIHPAEIDLGLDRVLVVLRRLFSGKPRARIITVAGTNGKGSTVAAVEALLQSAGRTTGAYTSPHLHFYNERIRINGAPVGDQALISAFQKVEEARKSVSLSYFEFGTLAAFVVFAEAGIQDWVLEVGLGGRLDAVNVMDPDLAILTSVDIDHVAFLGDDREQIGFEKAGILRPGIPAVCADSDPPRSVLQQASAQKVELALTGRDYRIAGEEGAGLVLDYRARKLRLPSGPLPVASMAAAAVALCTLEPKLSPQVMERTLADLRLPGRFEQMVQSPQVYVDVGHNPHAARWLAGRLAAMAKPGQSIHGVYGALGDKDIEGVVAAMKPVVSHWYLAGLDVPRGLSAEALAQRMGDAGIRADSLQANVSGAIDAALAAASGSDLVIVFGSFFTVADARIRLLGQAS